MNFYLHTNARRDTALSERAFQCDLGLEPRAMHRQHVSWCRPQFVRQKMDGVGDTRDELGTCEMESTDHLGCYLSRARRVRMRLTM